MNKSHLQRLLCSSLCLAGLVWAGTGLAHGQFTQNRNTIKVDNSGFPPDIQRGFQVFRMKCSECHGLDTSLKPSMSSAQWTLEVNRMQAMASSQFNDAQAKAILDFLNYDEAHRKAQLKPIAASSTVSTSDSPGQKFFAAQNCNSCHSIAGKGGSAGPSLTDVGAKLSRDQLLKVIQTIKQGESPMPPLPPETTDQQINDLVEYLMTLKG